MVCVQQSELNQLLDSLDVQVDTMMNENELGPIDTERAKGYQLAESVNAQLDKMSTTLRDLITRVNATYEEQEDSNNPMNQIVKILNSHLNSLQWIDHNASILQSKIQEVTKLVATGEQQRAHFSHRYTEP